MNQKYYSNTSGDLSNARRSLEGSKLLIFNTTADKFETVTNEIANIFPDIPNIGCILMSYDNSSVNTSGVSIIGFSDCEVVVDAIKNVSEAPVMHIGKLEKNIKSINPGHNNTFVFDICTNSDATVLATIYPMLKKYGIILSGGTGDGGKVSINGEILEDATVYALVKNTKGKVAVYKENIYRPMDNEKFIASDTNRENYYVGKLNEKSAKSVYMEKAGIKSESEFSSVTFKHPLGRLNGDDVSIVSAKEISGNGFVCYRQINDSDVVTFLELKDLTEIVEETKKNISKDFSRIGGILSCNCIFRYLMFEDTKQTNKYLLLMSKLGNHCGLIGFGEHYNEQFLNQSMSCIVFE